MLLIVFFRTNNVLLSQEKYDIVYEWNILNYGGWQSWRYSVILTDDTNNKTISGNFQQVSFYNFAKVTVPNLPSEITAEIYVDNLPDGMGHLYTKINHRYPSNTYGCFSLGANTENVTFYYQGHLTSNEYFPGGVGVKSILPYYNIASYAVGAIVCGDNNIVIKLTNSRVYCGSVKLQVKSRTSSSWSNSIYKNVSGQYVNISYRDVSSYVDKGELFDIRVLKPDGTTSQPVTGYVFLPAPKLDVSIESPKCNNGNAKITISGLNPSTHKTMFLKWGTLTSTENNNGKYEYPYGSGNYLFVDSPETEVILNVTETTKTLSKQITETSYYFFEVRYDGMVCSEYKVLPITNPTAVVYNSAAVTDIITKVASPALPDGTYQASSTTGAWSAKLGISGGTGFYRKDGGTTNLAMQNGRYNYNGTGASATDPGQGHAILIEDTNGCNATTTPVVNIKCPSPLSIAKSQTPATYVCGTSKTSFKYNVTGGVGPFTSNLTKDGTNVTGYSNITINDRNEKIVSGLEAGNYVLSITDKNSTQNNNTKTYTFDVEQRNNPTFTATPHPTSHCNNTGNDGSITLSNLTGYGGTYEYSYRAGTQGNFTSNSTTTFSAKAAGTYQVKVTNSGCNTIQTVTVPTREMPSVSLNGTITDQICDLNGSALFSLSGLESGDAYVVNILNQWDSPVGNSVTDIATSSTTTVAFNSQLPGSKSGITYKAQLVVGNDIGCVSITTNFDVGEATNPLSNIGYEHRIKESCLNEANAVIELSNVSENVSGSYTVSGGGVYDAANYTISGLSEGTNYSFLIEETTSTRGCSHTLEVNDIELYATPIGASTSNNINAKCFDSNTGSIELHATGGVASGGENPTGYYSFYIEDEFKGTNTNASYTYSGLANGDYTLKVVDDIGCEYSVPITINHDTNSPVAINPIVEKSDYYCAEGTQGSFKVSAISTASSNNLSYSLSTSSVTFSDVGNNEEVSFENLAYGNHTLTVRDELVGCADAKVVSISNKDYEPDVAVSSLNLLACSIAEDGKVELRVTDYTDANDSAQGFDFSFKDEDDVEISPDSPNISLIKTYSSLSNQQYSAVVTDAFGCVYSNSVQVNERPDRVTVSIPVATNTSCMDADNGTLSVSASDGASISGDYTFELYYGSETTPKQTIVGANANFVNLQVGEYKVKVIDDQKCFSTSGAVSVNCRSNILSISSVEVVEPTCNLGSDGSITSTIDNNNFAGASYTYNIYRHDGTNYWDYTNASYNSSTNTFNNLVAGLYKIEVLEVGQPCGVEYSGIIVNEPDPIQITAPQLKCISKNDGSTGEFSISISEGNKSYTYQWFKDNVLLESSSLSYLETENEVIFTKTGLSAGTYKFTLRDIEGCNYFNGSDTYEKTVVISQPIAPLILSATVTHETCEDYNDGRLVLTASGGWLCSEHVHTDLCNNEAHNNCPEWTVSGTDNCKEAHYLYSIGGGWGCDNEFGSLDPGTYIAKVMDKAGNVVQQEITIHPRPAISLNITNDYDATCPGYTNGRVLASVSIDDLGKNNIDYTITCTDAGSAFADVNINGNNAFGYNNLPKGNYTLNIEDVKGCTDLKPFTIGEPDTAEITYDFNYILDKGASTGWINIDVEKGNQVFDYQVFKKSESVYQETDNSAGGIYLGDLYTGTYLVQVRDTAGCVYESDEWMERTIVIREPQDALSFDIKDLTNVSCKSFGNAYVEATAAGGWGNAYTYTLNGTGKQNNGVYTGLTPGLYTLQIKDTVGVTRDWDFEITEPDSLTIVVNNTFGATCPLYANGRIEASVENGIDFYNGLQFSIRDVNDPSNYHGNFRDLNRLYEYGKLPKGEYEITVRDSNACVDTDVFAIGEPDTAIINIDHNFIRAKGDSTGFINIGIDNGNQWFNYEWYSNDDPVAFDQGQVANALNLYKLPAGEYKLMIRDTAGCAYESAEWMERTIRIREPEKALRFNLIQNKPVSCFEFSDGLIEVAAEGGWGDYVWVNNSESPQNNGVFDQLVSGEYSITIQDSTGISWDSTLVMIQPDLFTASYQSHKDINCYNGSDGEIALDVNGGNEQYFISLDQLTWDEDTKVDSLKIGTYNLYVKDEKECSALVENIKLIQPDEILVAHDTIIKSRCSNNEGSIQTKFEGGVGVYSYSWFKVADDYTLETPLTGETTSNIYDLFSSRYKVLVTDEHLCTLPFEFVVGDITDLEIDTIQVTPVSCFGYSDGNAKAEVINGNKPYYYSWPSSIIQQDNDTVWGLISEEYELLIRDDKGCRTSKKFFVETPDPLGYDTLSFADPLCYGGVQGVMEVQAKGGTYGYNYLWSNGTASHMVNNIEPGTYSLTLTDSHSCIAQFNVNFAYQRKLTPFIGNDTLICHYDSIIINPGFYHTYSLVSDAGYNSILARPVIKDPSVYYLQVTDTDNCLGYDTLALDVSYLNIAAVDVADVTCTKFADGEAQISVAPSNWKHRIKWPDNSTANNWTNLSGGNYTVEVFDDYGCTDRNDFNVYEPDTLNYEVSDILDPLCLGNFNGYIHGEVQGGVLPYTVNWNNGISEQNINDVDTGYYRIDVTDANNCFYQKDFSFHYRRTLAPFAGNDTLICHYNTLPLNAGNYNKFAWTADHGFSSSKQKVDLKDPGTYYLQVTDKDKCLGFDTIKLDVSYLKISDFKYQDVTCNGDADGWAQVKASPANWTHTIEWTDGSANNNWTGLKGGNYNVRVLDTYGCEDNHPFSIYEPDAMALTVNKLMIPLCFGVPDGEIDLSTAGGRTPYTYSWKHGENNNRINRLDTGYYFVDIYDIMNCHIDRGFDLRYETAIYPVLGEDKVLCEGNTVRLYPGDFETYKWSNTLGNTANDTAWVVGDKAEYYVEVMDNQDCVGRDTVKVDTRQTDLTPEFLMASSVPVGDTLMIIEVSQPKPQSFDWYLSGKHQVVEKSDYYTKVIFEEEGAYEIILNAHSYNCMAQARKTILVTPYVDKENAGQEIETQNTKIISLVASPNPSDGAFYARLVLDEVRDATYYLVRIENGQIIDKRKVNGLNIYNEAFNISAPGVYAVFVEVGDERRVVKVIVH